MKNIDKEVVKDFGIEWDRFQQSELSEEELEKAWKPYFGIFPIEELDENSIGFDMGCGSGRWASFIAPKVEKLFCVDPSVEALKVAKENLSSFTNCEYVCCTAENFSVPDKSMDFGYSLGVLHHVSNTEKSLINCVRKLKKDAPFLLYLYYQLENRSFLYKFIWKLSDIARFIISRMPFQLKKILTDCIAIGIYWPFSRLAKIINLIGFLSAHPPPPPPLPATVQIHLNVLNTMSYPREICID